MATWLASVCLLVIIELAASAPVLQSSGNVEKRESITGFSDLKKTCLSNGWYRCYDHLNQIAAMSGGSQNRNSTVSVCLSSARWYLNSSATNTTVSADNCSLSDVAKMAARRSYCDLLTLLKWLLKSYIESFLPFFFYDAKSGKVKDSIIEWSRDWAGRHSTEVANGSCCAITASRSARQMNSISPNWCLNEPQPQQAQCRWEKLLGDAGVYMRIAELLDSLVRSPLQPKCPACASADEVNCFRLLLPVTTTPFPTF